MQILEGILLLIWDQVNETFHYIEIIRVTFLEFGKSQFKSSIQRNTYLNISKTLSFKITQSTILLR